MNEGEFLHALQDKLALPDREATEKVARCVLNTLADRLTPEEAMNVEAQLPEGIKAMWHGGLADVMQHVLTGSSKISREDFIAHVAKHLGVPIERAIRTIEGVFAVLQQEITPGLAEHLQAQLPKGLKVMWLESNPVTEQAGANQI